MKKQFILILFSTFLLNLNVVYGFQTNENFTLVGIQDSIYSAFTDAIVVEDPTNLLTIGEQLTILAEERNLEIITYWRAYHAYYTAIYFAGTDNSDKAEDLVDEHISLMEEIETPTAEYLALLSMIRSFSIQFKAMFRAPFISAKVSRDLEKALNIEPNNSRVLYVKASSDYYTPEQFGGGKQVEELLTKVIEAEAPEFVNPVLPTWGKREAYELLLQWYIRKEKKAEAKALFDKASDEFPFNYRIAEMGELIAGM